MCVCVCFMHIWLLDIQMLCGCFGVSPDSKAVILFRLTVGGLAVLCSLRSPSTRLLRLTHTPTHQVWEHTWAQGVSDTEISMVTACSIFLWCICLLFPENQQLLQMYAHMCLRVPMMGETPWGCGTAFRLLRRERKHWGPSGKWNHTVKQLDKAMDRNHEKTVV